MESIDELQYAQSATMRWIPQICKVSLMYPQLYISTKKEPGQYLMLSHGQIGSPCKPRLSQPIIASETLVC